MFMDFQITDFRRNKKDLIATDSGMERRLELEGKI